jgi:hypothetical protein
MTTTESSIAGDLDGRKKRWEGHELRKTVLGKKHDQLGQSKVSTTRPYHDPISTSFLTAIHRKTTLSADSVTSWA